MRRKAVWIILSGLLAVGMLILPACVAAAPSPQIYRIGILVGAKLFDGVIDGFKQQMADYGYIEGENIQYDIKRAHGDPDAMRAIADKFVADDVDLILTVTNGAALAARRATENTDVPVLFTFVLAPKQTGVVDNLRQPGGNLTGVRNPLEIFIGKRLEFLQKISPAHRRVWTPYDPNYPTEKTILTRLRKDAAILNITLIETPVQNPDDIATYLQTFSDNNPLPFDAIMMMPDLVVQSGNSWTVIKQFATSRKIPIIANTMQQVEDGALFGYFTENTNTGRAAARIAQQILSGVSPANLPVETADVFFIINMRAASALDIIMPPDILHQADTIIR